MYFEGGIRSAIIFVRGSGAFRALRYEAGVHRVQRFPSTDKTRMHTSTSVVAVLPEPEKVHFFLVASFILLSKPHFLSPFMHDEEESILIHSNLVLEDNLFPLQIEFVLKL